MLQCDGSHQLGATCLVDIPQVEFTAAASTDEALDFAENPTKA